MHRCLLLAILLVGLSSTAIAYDFTTLTELAEGALIGENVGQPVSGFEIRLTQHGELLYHQVFGDWSLNRPANVDSSTKTLSGALMMSVAETAESGFSLDSHLSDFLPEFDKPGYQDITIRQAFSHSSGLPGEDVGSLILLNPFITLRQAAFQVSELPLENAPPGSRFAYGGLSMQAAGAAAEVATGVSYIDLFAERITTPLEMTNTQFVLASDNNPRVAGGIESTATDFGRFMDMLLNDGVDRVTGTRVLSTAAVAEMLTRQTSDDQIIVNSPADNNRYGIGVWLDQLVQAGPSVDALAAGARGFHSWIDQSYGLVMTLATDETVFSNVEVLSSLMHSVILQAVADPGDFNFDGVVDGRDFLAWQRGESPTPLSAGDLVVWQANCCEGATAGLSSSAVPEPAISYLITITAACGLATTRPSPLAASGHRRAALVGASQTSAQ
jgi:CubicO group peptidase (beta-lactamase class C family)